ncbi:unnamed protein product [Moneuplotes crassus]|uniref:Uncharacterized protein n=1 Tax=Euplotes crassus TaxID=5936 RepID=A0AAD2D379_EUPCR|nr:unnamed protein product [Moneuplotes crassus]
MSLLKNREMELKNDLFSPAWSLYEKPLCPYHKFVEGICELTSKLKYHRKFQ